MAFKNGNVIIFHTATDKELMNTTAATLRLISQKNSVRGILIHRSSKKGILCPVKALVRRFIYLQNNKAKKNDLISTYWDHLCKAHVKDEDMQIAIHRAVITLGLEKNGILASRVGTHSVRARGVMALKFADADRGNIKKMGRWSSDTCLLYIHGQIAEYLEGRAEKMVVPRYYFNIEGALTDAD